VADRIEVLAFVPPEIELGYWVGMYTALEDVLRVLF
jgi:hypothetical protein